MNDNRVVVLQGADIKKLQEELTAVIQGDSRKPTSITQSQSGIPAIGSRPGWESVITITVVYADE